MSQRLERQTIRKPTGIGDLKPIHEQHDLHAGVAGIVAMCHRVDDPFSNHIPWDLIGHRCSSAVGTCSHPSSNLRHHEIDGLINQLEHGPLVGLIRRDWLGNLGPVKMSALDFRSRKELLRLLPEQQHGSIGDTACIEQVQMRQQVSWRSGFGQWKTASIPGLTNKGLHSIAVQIRQFRWQAGSSIPRAAADQLVFDQIIDQRGIHSGP